MKNLLYKKNPKQNKKTTHHAKISQHTKPVRKWDD